MAKQRIKRKAKKTELGYLPVTPLPQGADPKEVERVARLHAQGKGGGPKKKTKKRVKRAKAVRVEETCGRCGQDGPMAFLDHVDHRAIGIHNTPVGDCCAAWQIGRDLLVDQVLDNLKDRGKSQDWLDGVHLKIAPHDAKPGGRADDVLYKIAKKIGVITIWLTEHAA